MSEYVVAIGTATQQVLAPRENLIVNPSFEVNTTGWDPFGFFTATRITTDSFVGNACVRIARTSTGGDGTNNGYQLSDTSTYRIPVTPGEVLTASAYVKTVVGTRPVELRIRTFLTDTDPTPVGNAASAAVFSTSWERLSVSITVPVGSTYVDVLVRTAASGAVGDAYVLDAVMVEKSSSVNTYFDGSFTNTNNKLYSWTGTPDLSTSLEQTLWIPEQVLTFFDSWTLERNIDDGCQFTFSCPGNSIPGVQISELATDIWLYEQSTLVDRFRVVEVTQTWDRDGRDTINVQAVCYRRILASRHVVSDLTFSATSQGDIVFGLIQHTQAQLNGDLGITLSSAGPTVIRDREYIAGTNILEAIVELSQIDDGIAWEINEDLELTVTQPQLFNLRPQPVVLGVNALTVTRPSGAPSFANAAVVSGDGNATVPEVLTAPSLAIDARGRWEKYRGFPQETTQVALQEAARGLLQTAISPSIRWSFELEAPRYFLDSDYQIGDYVLIKQPNSVVPSGSNPTIPSFTYVGGVVAAQIMTQSIQQSQDGEITVSMTAIQVLQRWIDIPSTPVLRWVDVDPSLTWFDLLTELL